MGDIHKLKQVIRNIISNALKFTREGGMVTVTLSVHSQSSFTAMSSLSLLAAVDCNNGNSNNKSSSFLTNATAAIDIDEEEEEEKIVYKYYLKLSVEDSGPGISVVLF